MNMNIDKQSIGSIGFNVKVVNGESSHMSSQNDGPHLLPGSSVYSVVCAIYFTAQRPEFTVTPRISVVPSVCHVGRL